MKPRVLLLEALPVVAGGQRVLLDLLPGLADWELHALLPGPGALANALTGSGVTCHFEAMADYALVRKSWRDVARFPLDQLRLATRCARLARRLDADLLYANCSRTFVWGTLGAALARKRLIWHVHNMLGDRKTSALLRGIGRLSSVCRVIAVSRQAAAQFSGLARKTVVVPATVDTTIFHPDHAARDRVRDELGIPPNARVVGIVGDLIPLKGQLTLLDAARRGPPDARCLVVGDARPGDQESAAYAAMLRDNAGPNVMFTGRREDLADVLNSLDALVIASDRETGPLVLLEALACGIPVISTPVGRAPDLLPADRLFPAANAGALHARLEALFADAPAIASARRDVVAGADRHSGLDQYRAEMRSQIESCLAGGSRWAARPIGASRENGT